VSRGQGIVGQDAATQDGLDLAGLGDRAGPPPVRAWRDPWAWAAVGVLLWSVASIALEVHSARRLQFDMDEAVHARAGQEHLAAWRTGHPAAVLGLFARPDWYPPLDGMLRGLWYAAVGSSTTTARLYNTFVYALVAGVLWRSVRQLHPAASRGFAFLPVLALATDPLHATGAAMAMLEVPALLWTLLALHWHARALSGGPGWRHGAASLAAVAAFLTRYENGVIVMAALGISHLVRVTRDLRGARPLRRGVPPVLWYAAPILLFVPAWLFGLGQIEWFLSVAGTNLHTMPGLSEENLLHYPRLLMRHPFTAATTMVLGLGVAWSLVARRFPPGALPYLVHLTLGLGLLTFRIEFLDRNATLFVSAVWLLASFYLAWASLHWRGPAAAGDHPAAPAALALALLLLGFVIRPTPADFHGLYENTNAEITRAYREVARVTRPWERSSTHVVMFGRSDQRPGHALEFHLASTCERRGRSCDVDVQDTERLSLGWPLGSVPRDGSAKRMEAALARADFVVVFGRLPERLSGWKVVAEETYNPAVEGRTRLLKLTVLTR